jgi:ribose 5-phosphate isomerase B
MLYIASDHAGFKLKKYLIEFIKEKLEKEIIDLGPDKFNKDDDYPDFAIALSKKVLENKNNSGVLICGSGNGMCMTANKFKGIHAIVGYSIQAAEASKQDDVANVLCLAGSVLTEDHAKAIVTAFLNTYPQIAERHLRRIKKIDTI